MAIRYHYMDNLRAIAMLAGIFFHAALAYSPLLANVWLPADPQTSVVLDAAAWFSHLFRMPLFFLIAGFFSVFLIERKGVLGFIRNRARRILLPFIIFLPVMWVSFAVIIGWALTSVGNPSPILKIIAEAAKNPDAPPPPISTTHLWFLYNLGQIYVVFLLLRRSGLLTSRWISLLSTPGFLLFGVPVLLTPALSSVYTPHPAPEQFTPQLWSLGFFGVFFLVGTQMYVRPDVLVKLRPAAPWLTATSLLLYGILYQTLPPPISMEDAVAASGAPPMSLLQIAKAGLEAIIATHMTVVCLVVGHAYLNSANRVTRFIADASYWMYIMHLPVLWILQFLLLDVDANLWVKFFLGSMGTLLIGLATYVLFVRWTPFGWLVDGRSRTPPPAPQPGAA